MDQPKNLYSVAVDPLTLAVLNASEQGICILDEAGRLLILNPVAQRLLGGREQDWVGRPVLSELGLRPEAMATEVWRGSARPVGIESRAMVRWRRPDGSLVHLRCKVSHVLADGRRLIVLCLESAAPIPKPEEPACDLESNFGAILETITDGVIVIDEAGIIQLLNPAAERLFDYPREQAIGRNVEILMPSPDRERHGGYLDKYRCTGVKTIIGRGREVLGRRKDGTVFPMYLSIGELQQGNRRQFVGIIHDLTARKQAEDKLRLLSGALDQSPVGVLIASLDGRIEYVNQGFSRLTGYDPEEVIGRSLKRLQADQALQEKGREALWESLRAGKEWHGEIQARKRDGDLYWALETLAPIRDRTGKVTRYLAMQQDVTQQKRDRDALQESEERFRLVAEMVGEWLWEQDASGRYTYSSAAVRDILGYSPEEIVGKHYLDLMTDEDRRLWSEMPAERVTASFRKLINHYRHRNGKEVYTESTGAPLLDPDGRVLKWRGMDQDITARKYFEDALRLRDRAMEAASVGIAIGDARQPGYPSIYVNPALCRITGYSREELLGQSLRLLQGPETDEAAREKIRHALREGIPCELILRNYRKDGTTFWNELLLSPVYGDDGALTHYIGIQTDVSERRRAEEERHELEIAKQIQLSLLPKLPLRLRGAEIAGVCLPATHVGGDYFDFFGYDDNIDIVIADVSGHSVGAALIMAEMRSTLKAEIRRDRDEPSSTADILAAINEVLYGDLNSAEFFITMFYLRYELETRRLRYANAGHNRALLLRRNANNCVQLDADGLILGVRRGVAFEEKGLVLQPDDRLLLYTDGAIEAQNDRGEFFGLSRLCNAFYTHRSLPPEAMLQILLGELRAFRGKSEFQDDISMVAIRAA